jgi:cyclopropane-fatty-acyl-phospholipid synthase
VNALYEVTISHARSAPLRNVFRYRGYLWLVDLDHLPRVRLLAGFRARDHLGDPRRGIRENLDRFLAANGIARPHTITMLTQARVLGYVFNPLTVYWCHRPECVVAEVHNTYGQRYAYLLHPDTRGRARVPKQFYVSPFYPVDGGYRMSLPEPGANPGDRLALSVRLDRPDGHSFAASVRGRRHSRARDRAVIAGHYHVPSAFYQLILDPSMAYSCAYWDPQAVDLAAAQRAKLELIGRKLALTPGQSLLDMGCGWGSLTIHAARARFRVTGVTLSREQGGYVRRRARGLGLAEDRVQVRIQDYRDPLERTYDAVASVEMGEHVGAAVYPAFCAALYGKLRPGGRLLIQQMSRTTRRGGGPFIESYIAPDMDMRPVGETIRLIQDAGFEVLGVEAMREHYARTIRAWLENFEANLPAITTILTAEQVRVWRLYLAGGALAFEQGRMGVDQILAVKPQGTRR